MPPPPEARPLRLLISFSPEDRELKDRLVRHLQVLVRFAGIELWSADRIRAGADWRQEIDHALEQADVALLLISADFLASDFLQDVEVPKLFKRREEGGLRVVPVLLRSCHWEAVPWLERLAMLPERGKAVAAFEGDARDAALVEIAKEIANHREAPSAPSIDAVNDREIASFYVPFLRNPAFVGRDDDLEALHHLLHDARTAGVRPAALTGMGGIGKTQLAVEYAYRYRDAYSGGVYWVNAAEPWQAEFARLAIEVGLGAEDAPEAERRMRLALAFAKHLGERPDALVVFDNVEDPLALRSPGAGFVPEQLGCRLLFTTRRRDPDSPYQTVDVRVLPQEVALRLLLAGGARSALLDGGSAAEVDAAKSICASLGYLPLALVLAAAFLARYPRISLANYLVRIRKEGAIDVADAAKVDPRRLGTLHDAAVGATLQTQWDALESEDAKLVLNAAALLGEAALAPRARLALLTGLADAAEPGYPAALEEALRELGRLSLVEELTERDIRLHPLVREFAEGRIERREAFAAACATRLSEALSDMGRLHEEVAARGIDAVLGDLRAGSKLAGPRERRWLAALMRPLDRDAHTLRGSPTVKEPRLFLQWLRNLSFEMNIEEVRERAEAKLNEQGWPWLRACNRTRRESDALVRTLQGHSDHVTGVAVTADGRFAVSTSKDKTLKVWNLGTGHAMRTLEGHTRRASGVVVTADGGFAISASDDKTLKVWNLGTGQVAHTLEGHTNHVTSVAVTADGCFAISASKDKTLKVWNLGTGQVVHTLVGHGSHVLGVALTADGRTAISASKDRTLKVWDLGSGRVVRTLTRFGDRVSFVAVTADGRLAMSSSQDGTLWVWDFHTGHGIRGLKGHASPILSVAVTADNHFAVSASEDNTLVVWDLDTGQAVRTLQGHNSQVTCVAVTADGRFAVSASEDTMLKVWDLDSGSAKQTVEVSDSQVASVAVTADGYWVQVLPCVADRAGNIGVRPM